MGQNKLHEQSIRTSSALSTTPGPQVRPGSLTWQAHARICNFTGNDAKVILCIGRSRSISSEWPIKIIPVTSRLFLTAFARPGRDDRCNKCVQPARATRKQRCMYQSTPHINVQCILSPSEYDSKSIAALHIPSYSAGATQILPMPCHACGEIKDNHAKLAPSTTSCLWALVEISLARSLTRP
jgi:hypothetical protein